MKSIYCVMAFVLSASALAADKVPGAVCWNGKAYPQTIVVGVNAQQQMAYVNAAVLADDGNNDTPWYEVQESHVERAKVEKTGLLEIVDSQGGGKYFDLKIGLNTTGPARGEGACKTHRCMKAHLIAINQIKVGPVSEAMAKGIDLTCMFRRK